MRWLDKVRYWQKIWHNLGCMRLPDNKDMRMPDNQDMRLPGHLPGATAAEMAHVHNQDRFAVELLDL